MGHRRNGQPIVLKVLFFGLCVGGAPLALLMSLAPDSSITKRMVASNALIQGYAGLYTLLFARAIIQEPQVFLAAVKLDVDTLIALTGKRRFAMAVWTHASTCDLFIARWIYLDSMRRGRVARVPLLLQYVLGPVGMLTYLTIDRRNEDTLSG